MERHAGILPILVLISLSEVIIGSNSLPTISTKEEIPYTKNSKILTCIGNSTITMWCFDLKFFPVEDNRLLNYS